MPRVLLTAFKPYQHWTSNASWATIVELTKEPPSGVDLTTRLYPVDYQEVRRQLVADLAQGFDYAIHLGQAPGAAELRLEAIGLNVAEESGESDGDFRPLAADGPVAYQSDLPLGDWARRLREAGIPAIVSHCAGRYLCNATLYWSRHLAAERGWPTRATFVHVPLEPRQAALQPGSVPSLSAECSAIAMRMMLDWLADGPTTFGA